MPDSMPASDRRGAGHSSLSQCLLAARDVQTTPPAVHKATPPCSKTLWKDMPLEYHGLQLVRCHTNITYCSLATHTQCSCLNYLLCQGHELGACSCSRIKLTAWKSGSLTISDAVGL